MVLGEGLCAIYTGWIDMDNGEGSRKGPSNVTRSGREASR